MTRTAQNPLPPDRSHLPTEQRHRRAAHLDQHSIAQCVKLMVDDHRTVAEAVDAAAHALEQFIAALVPRLRAGGRLIYVGAGTSGRLGVLDASECPPTFQSNPDQIIGIIAGGDSALRRSSEAMEDDPHGAQAEFDRLDINQRDTLLGIAAGGTTPYVLGAVRLAKQRGAATGLLTCSPQHTHPDGCDHLIILDTGPEILTGSTRLKAGSATKLALNIITTTAFVQLGKVYSNLMVDLRATNAKLHDRAMRILTTVCPELTRVDAGALLDRADGELKTALVMQRLTLDPDPARARLDQCSGNLREALTRTFTDSGAASD